MVLAYSSIIRAQRNLGAAKTSAYYAVAPFVGAFLAFVLNGEKLTLMYFIGLILMVIGSVFVVYDTIVKHHVHSHSHSHTIVHTHNGVMHTHVISHIHEHSHFGNESRHKHQHDDYINSREHKLSHAHIV